MVKSTSALRVLQVSDTSYGGAYSGAPIWALSPLPPSAKPEAELSSSESMVRTGCSLAPLVGLASVALSLAYNYVHDARAIAYTGVPIKGAAMLVRDEGLLVRAIAYVGYVSQSPTPTTCDLTQPAAHTARTGTRGSW